MPLIEDRSRPSSMACQQMQEHAERLDLLAVPVDHSVRQNRVLVLANLAHARQANPALQHGPSCFVHQHHL
jgi:hypothetical protein